MNLDIEKRRLLQTLSEFFVPKDSRYIADFAAKTAAQVAEGAAFTDVMGSLNELKLLLAGGAVTSLFSGAAVNDLDFYMEDPEKREAAIEFFGKYFKELPFVSPNCVTFKRKSSRSNKVWTVQLITRFHGCADDIFKKFDFTITTGAYQFSDHTWQFGPRFFPDLALRRLTYMGSSRYPICALYRTKKYQARGYACPGSTVMHIGLAIVQLEIKTYADLKEQLLGVDTMFLQGLLEQEKYGAALPVDYGAFLEDAFKRMNVFSGEIDE